MALEKQISIDFIEVSELGSVQVRKATKIIEDGVEISRSLHRYVIDPGNDYSQEPARVQAVCAAVHTPEVVAAHQARLAAIEAENQAKMAEIEAQMAEQGVKP